MSNLADITRRHRGDRWRDALFVSLGVAATVLVTALSIGSATSKAAGKEPDRPWSVTVIESNLEIVR